MTKGGNAGQPALVQECTHPGTNGWFGEMWLDLPDARHDVGHRRRVLVEFEFPIAERNRRAEFASRSRPGTKLLGYGLNCWPVGVKPARSCPFHGIRVRTWTDLVAVSGGIRHRLLGQRL